MRISTQHYITLHITTGYSRIPTYLDFRFPIVFVFPAFIRNRTCFFDTGTGLLDAARAALASRPGFFSMYLFYFSSLRLTVVARMIPHFVYLIESIRYSHKSLAPTHLFSGRCLHSFSLRIAWAASSLSFASLGRHFRSLSD